MQSVNCRSETGGLGRGLASSWPALIGLHHAGPDAAPAAVGGGQMFETALCKFLGGARRSTQRMVAGNAGRGVEHQSVRPVWRAVGEGAGAGDSAVAGSGRGTAGG